MDIAETVLEAQLTRDIKEVGPEAQLEMVYCLLPHPVDAITSQRDTTNTDMSTETERDLIHTMGEFKMIIIRSFPQKHITTYVCVCIHTHCYTVVEEGEMTLVNRQSSMLRDAERETGWQQMESLKCGLFHHQDQN